MTYVEELAETFRKAERRLRAMLFGDGTYTAGYVRGEDARQEVARELRRLRNAFDEAIFESQQERALRLEERVADLEEELRKLAASRSRKRTKRTQE